MNMYLLYGLGIGNTSVKKYFDLRNIKYRIYQDNENSKNSFEEILADIKIIVKSSGIQNDTPLLKYAHDKLIKIVSDIELFYNMIKHDSIIAISGSNGKTTVANILGQLLKEEGYQVCGNIGMPVFDYYNQRKFIIECSSYMLDNIEHFKPNIYVIINIEKHHLDYHKSFANYIKAKIKPLKVMTKDDYVIYPQEDILIRRIIDCYEVNKIPFSINDKIFFDVNKLKLEGNHNIKNVQASLKVLQILKINQEDKFDILYNILPLSHRLELFFSPNYPSTFFINDSKSTNVYSLCSALKFIDKYYLTKTVHLIIGGMAIDQDYSIVFNQLNKYNFIYSYGNAGLKYCENLIINYQHFPNLHLLLQHLRMNCFTKNDIVLFSPGAPSKDEFHSFEERGNFFKSFFTKT